MRQTRPPLRHILLTTHLLKKSMQSKSKHSLKRPILKYSEFPPSQRADASSIYIIYSSKGSHPFHFIISVARYCSLFIRYMRIRMSVIIIGIPSRGWDGFSQMILLKINRTNTDLKRNTTEINAYWSLCPSMPSFFLFRLFLPLFFVLSFLLSALFFSFYPLFSFSNYRIVIIIILFRCVLAAL